MITGLILILVDAGLIQLGIFQVRIKDLGETSTFQRCGHQLAAEVGDKW